MRRLRVAVAIGVVAVSLGWVATRGFATNLVYYRTPTEVVQRGDAAAGERIRVGGVVVPGSRGDVDGAVRFVVTDGTTRLTVIGTGGVPSLFRDGQGVVVEGVYGDDGAFHADTVLIKHDADYRPPAPGETPHSARLEEG